MHVLNNCNFVEEFYEQDFIHMDTLTFSYVIFVSKVTIKITLLDLEFTYAAYDAL